MSGCWNTAMVQDYIFKTFGVLYSVFYNPIEQLWRKIKKKGTHLKYFPTFDSLMAKVDEMLAPFTNTPADVLKVFGF